MKTFKITIDHTKVPSNLTDFPVYVDLSDMPSDFWTTVTDGGGDIRCYESDEITQLPREVVSCDTSTSTGELHIKSDLSSSTDTIIIVAVDGTGLALSPSSPYGSQNVWSVYKGVYHLQEGGTTSDNAYLDSSGNNSGGTGSSGVTTDSASKLGVGTAFNGNTRINIGNGTALQIIADISLTGWIKPTNYSTYRAFVSKTVSNAPVSFDTYFMSSSGYPQFYRGGSGTNYNVTGAYAPTTGVWSHYAFTQLGSTAYHYLNGANNNSGTAGGSYADGGTNAMIGNRSDGATKFLGSMDEIRITNVALTADWIATEYNNQNDASSFYTVTESITGTTIKIFFDGSFVDKPIKINDAGVFKDINITTIV